MVPDQINGEAQLPYKGVGKHQPSGNRYGPPIVSCADYPADGNKSVVNTLLRISAQGSQLGNISYVGTSRWGLAGACV